jgi:putative acyl-CoA dehydrogenase
MALAMRHRIHDIAWAETRPGRHLLHAAMLAVFTQAEAGVMCPISMTYASVPALRQAPELAKLWLPKIIGGTYDAPLKPLVEKAGVTIGMAMTEKQGGSDVRANTTKAIPSGEMEGAYRLVGHKWFCSAPMSDGFLTLAYTDRGITCFFVPRITPGGERNSLHVMRLKDKLGNKSNASSEIEYHNTFAQRVGEEGRGVATIIEMVHHTRLDTMVGALGIMRRAFAEAVHHVTHRRAFQRKLIDQPLMRAVIADLALDYEGAAFLAMRVARAFDGENETDRGLARLAVALGKYWVTKRTPQFVYECLECLGGGGYVEESALARYYREAPLNAIWEGSGNVIALDILRTLQKEPAGLEALVHELEQAKGAHPQFDSALEDAKTQLSGGGAVPEAQARITAESLALLAQSALLLLHAPDAVAQAFCASRLPSRRAVNYGAGLNGADVDAIVMRHADL